MKLKPGDKVKFLNESMEGIVSSVDAKGMVQVTVGNDFEIPARASDLVRISNEEYSFSKDIQAASIVKKAAVGIATGLFASFVQKGEEDVEMYFVNHSDHRILLNCFSSKNGNIESLFFGTVDEFAYKVMIKLKLSDLNKWPFFHFQILYKPESEFHLPLNKNLHIISNSFFKHLRPTPIINAHGYLYRLDETLNKEDVDKLVAHAFEQNRSEELMIEKPSPVIDLHIDKLHNNFTQLTKQESLQIQSEHFQKNLDHAIAHGMPQIIFIHGVGNGRLKNEIQRLLKMNKQIKSFQDADPNKYGSGATLVIIKDTII